MGFEDFFEQGHKHYKHDYDHHHEQDDYYPSAHSHNHQFDIKYQLLSKLQNNPKFRVFIIIAAIVILTIIIIAAMFLIPLIVKLFEYAGQNGIQGLIETIWKGTK